LARACGGSITDEEGVGLFFEAIRQLERPCLIIHHTNRSDTFFGSSYILANARNMWRLNSAPGESGSMSLSLTQEKENDGPNMGSLSLSLTFHGDKSDAESVILATQDPALAPYEVQKTLKLLQRLEITLKETLDHRMSQVEIIEQLDLGKSNQGTLRNYFWALKNKTGKYKRLAGIMHVQKGEPDYLCLNTATGYKAYTGYDVSPNGTGPIEPMELEPKGEGIPAGGSTADYLKSRGARSPEVASEPNGIEKPDELVLGFNKSKDVSF
jgi:hypothetical protein